MGGGKNVSNGSNPSLNKEAMKNQKDAFDENAIDEEI
jgi:hypothetical protein